MTIALCDVVMQSGARTVGAALQSAIVSLLKCEQSGFKKSFLVWAGFMIHGCADVVLDTTLLENIAAFLKAYDLVTEAGDVNTSELAAMMPERRELIKLGTDAGSEGDDVPLTLSAILEGLV